MPELAAVVGADVERSLGGPRTKATIDFNSDMVEMLAQRPGDAGEIGMVAEHDFLGHRVIELGRRTVPTEYQPQGITWLLAHLFGFEKMIGPGLAAQVEN